MVDHNESAWLEAALRGDRNAFGKLVQAYQVPVYNLAYRLLGNAADAEDAAQETFLKAFSRLHTYQPDMKFSNWLLSIASHHCIDRLRRRRFVWLSVEDDPSVEWLTGDGEQPDAAALRAEQARELQALINRLEPEYRTPVVLRYWYDLSYKEIAEIMGITEAALKSRLHRARLQLAEMLEAQPGEGHATTATVKEPSRSPRVSRAIAHAPLA
ncbi:MAG: sigma-70 family RNA polymerase sigma factor [Caldilineales bacterium]|nr:sigma-70 family RNA polymerase sigma factor [Caldilineales bacterium]MDW8318921.1 sigma-70 family RNA polymerase sigma factor [Anaerolineae bacterium]